MAAKKSSKLKKVLITGANGFIGKAVAVELISQGFNVLCAARSAFQVEGAKVLRVPDLEAQVDWSEFLAKVDCVIHTAAHVHHMNDFVDNQVVKDELIFQDENIYYKVNVRATLDLARAAADHGVKRFIFLSSAKVNGESTPPNQAFHEDDMPNPQDSYSLSKYQAEEGLRALARQTDMEVVIIRPPLVYGSGVKANFASMLNALKKRLPLPLGSIHNKRSLLYIGNLVSFILLCISHPKAANEVFFVSDGCDVSTPELLKACAAALGIKAILLPVPQAVLELGAKLLGRADIARRLCGSLQVDTGKSYRLLGWTPPVPMAEGLKATVGERAKTLGDSLPA